MSVLSSIVLSLLCFSLNAGAARHLGVVDNEPQKKSHLSVKEELEVNLGKVETAITVANATISSKDNAHDMMEKNQDQEEQLKGTLRHEDESERHKMDGEASSSTIKSKFEAVRVSWRVPYKKRGVPQPGFNLDYEPPRVHPPAHN